MMESTITHGAFAALALAALAFAAPPALGQEGATIEVDEHEVYGTYLTDGDGRPLYLFTTDTQGTEETDPQVSCSGACLEAWPPFYTDAEPQTGADEVKAELIDTMMFNGKTMVTYNGWPLYYFVKDLNSDEPTGQDVHGFGGEWYLVEPGGTKVGEKKAEADEE